MRRGTKQLPTDTFAAVQIDKRASCRRIYILSDATVVTSPSAMESSPLLRMIRAAAAASCNRVSRPNVTWFDGAGCCPVLYQPTNVSAHRSIGRYRRLKHRKYLTSLNRTCLLLYIYFWLQTAPCLCRDYCNKELGLGLRSRVIRVGIRVSCCSSILTTSLKSVADSLCFER